MNLSLLVTLVAALLLPVAESCSAVGSAPVLPESTLYSLPRSVLIVRGATQNAQSRYFETELAMNNSVSHEQRSLLLAYALPYPSPREPTEAARASRGGMESLWVSIKSNLLFRGFNLNIDFDISGSLYDYTSTTFATLGAYAARRHKVAIMIMSAFVTRRMSSGDRPGGIVTSATTLHRSSFMMMIFVCLVATAGATNSQSNAQVQPKIVERRLAAGISVHG